MELLSSGVWKGSGVLGPEPFDPDPYLALLDRYGIHHDMVEMEPGAHTPT
jgi:saccharopine dehydrogenase-like NADP-dependent oxidoreductase